MWRKTIRLSLEKDYGKPVVFVRLDPDPGMQIQQLRGARWHKKPGCWLFPKKLFNLNLFFEKLKDDAYIDYSGFTKVSNHSVSSLLMSVLKGYLEARHYPSAIMTGHEVNFKPKTKCIIKIR